MTNNHPITPPPELFAEWLAEAKRLHPKESLGFISGQIAQLAYRSGADQELEACINYFHEYDPSWGENSELITGLRSWRRPKLPSLKEQALALISHDPENQPFLSEEGIAIIRRALESLPE